MGTLVLLATPEDVEWRLGSSASAQVEELLATYEERTVNVEVYGASNAFYVQGLRATPYALKALIPLALWNSYGA